MNSAATTATEQIAPDSAPVPLSSQSPWAYDVRPTHPLPSGTLGVGFTDLAKQLVGHAAIRVDGFVGIDWENFRTQLDAELRRHGVDAQWVDVQSALKSNEEIGALIQPFLGGDDPLFGTRFTGELSDFFDGQRLRAIRPTEGSTTIFYGSGAGFVDCNGPLWFVDVPKNEIQYRSRAGRVVNLGATEPIEPKQQYKRMYFVDWVVLKRHVAQISQRVDLVIDDQRPDVPTFVDAETLRRALDELSRSVFRVRPWFEPGPWGGQWIKRRFTALPANVPNYAWSFELIVPENGLVLSDGQASLEVAFDWLMTQNHRAVLGECADWFDHEFPIRFNFLDTVDGGNLSVQCHPRPEYVAEHFGEKFTQDEAYYILDCKPGSEVFLGFRAGVDPPEFRAALERSFRENEPIDVKSFVNTVPAHQHDLFLIPHGTIHSSGKGNLVLEISATPYIFTFKMYDWLRLDLAGKPRPLNIERAFSNLNFDRQGERVQQELVSRPVEIASGPDWSLQHLPTHTDHFYDVHRYEFESEVVVNTDGSPHVLMLVEGTSIAIEAAGQSRQFSCAETFVVPAATGSYRLVNNGNGRSKVVKAFIKPSNHWPEWMHAGRIGFTAPRL